MRNITHPIVATLLACVVFPAILSAQDPRFSQYYASPWNLNPAMTGLFNGRWRVTANYRDQWSSILQNTPFRTYSAAADMRYNLGRYDYAAFGVGVLHDEAGTARFAQNRGHLAGAYLKKLAGGRNSADHYVAVGAQLGFGQNALEWGQLWFSRQYDPTQVAVNPGLSSGEPTTNGQTGVFADFNAGLLWYTVFKNQGFFYAGGAIHHINRPNISLLGDGGQVLYQRFSAHVGGQLPLTDQIGVLPGVQVMKQGPAFETDFGINLRYSNNDRNELALRFGAWGRLGNRLDKKMISDAVTVVGMLELERCVLGLSYDVTISSLSAANSSRGAFEVSFTYFHPGERRSRVVCPTF